MKTVSGFVAALLLGVGFGGVSQATQIATVTSGGASAEAEFTFGANTLTVLLKNTTVNPDGVAQNLSALTFTFAGGSGAALTSGSSPTSRTVNSNGTFSDAAGPATAATVGWVFSVPVANTYMLNVLSGTGHAGPAHTIIGLPGAGPLYSDANNSIAGNGPHNPFLFDRATWTFSITGVTAATLISGAQFQFGTADGNLVPGVCCRVTDPPRVPEPGTLALLALGLLGLGFSRRSKKI